MAAGDRIPVGSDAQLPALVWNSSNYSKWSLSSTATIATNGLALDLGGTTNDRIYAVNALNTAYGIGSGWIGFGFSTGNKTTQLKSVKMSLGKTFAFRLKNSTKNTIVYTSPANALPNGILLDLTSYNLYLEKNTTYQFEVNHDASVNIMYTHSGSWANWNSTTGANTGITFKGCYAGSSDTNTPSYDSPVYGLHEFTVTQYIPTSCNALSPIVPAKVVSQWHKFYAMFDTPANSTLSFDVEKTDGTKLLTGVTNGADISSLPLVDLRVRVNMARTDAVAQPTVKSAMVDWLGITDPLPAMPTYYNGYVTNNTGTYITASSYTGSGYLLRCMNGSGAYVKVFIDGVEKFVRENSTSAWLNVAGDWIGTEPAPLMIPFKESLEVKVKSSAPGNAYGVYYTYTGY